jgi:hypothetical protein
VKDVQLGLGVVFIQRTNLLLLFLDQLLISHRAILLIGLGLLELLPDQVQVLLELEFPLGQLVVFGGLGLDRLLEVALLFLEGELVVEQGLGS